MKVEFIDTHERFAELEASWRKVYAADPEASFFLSWEWLQRWLELLNHEWLVLAVREDCGEEHVAFLPLRIRTHGYSNGGCFTNFAMAGNRFADYTGFICHPQFYGDAIPALCNAIKSFRWGVVCFEGIRISELNLQRLLTCFPPEDFEIRKIMAVDPGDATDNSICPFVELAATWDDYLAGLSANSRQKLRRLIRTVEADPELKITHATEATFERDLDLLLTIWCKRWHSIKQERTAKLAAIMRAVLISGFRHGHVMLPILWSGSRAVGALALLLDSEKRTMLFLVGAREQDFAKPQPGLTLHAHTIRHAIEHGYVRYDFLRGNEPYKFAFGAREGHITSLAVKAKGARVERGTLDWRSVPAALGQANTQVREHRIDEADTGYRQILSLNPAQPDSLLGCARVMNSRRDGKAAECFSLKAIEALGNNADAARVELGRALILQGRHVAAEWVLARATAINPNNVAAHYQLGLVMEIVGRIDQAEECYQKAQSIDPEHPFAAQRLRKLAGT